MVLHYSPYFDSHSHLDVAQRGPAMLGIVVCGTARLLEQLELRCGIVAPQLSGHERLAAYHRALSAVAVNTVFNNSFAVDPIGTARQVMAWCEALAMEGWTPDTPNGDSAKLSSLAQVARDVKIKGMAQRWNDILSYVTRHRIMADDDTIEVHAPREIIPAVVLRVLDQLGAQFCYDSKPQLVATGDLLKAQRVLQGGEAEPLQHDESLAVKHFKHRAAACQWYLLNLNDFAKGVTVCNDTSLVNDLAHAIGCQPVDSTTSQSNPQTLQLFKLGLSLFARPLNVNNLLSYLRVPGHPAGGVAGMLAEALVEEGGIGEKWNQVLEEYDFTDDKGRDRRADSMKFVELVTKSHPNNVIITDDVRQYAHDLAHWADTMLRSEHIDDLRKEQLAVLGDYCRALVDMLSATATIAADKLQQLVNGIYQPHAFTHCRATRHSAETVASPLQLVDPARSLCWLGCVGSDMMPYPFEFVNEVEFSHLAVQGIKLITRTDYYALQQQMVMSALARVTERLTLITWDYDGNASVEQHPVVTHLATAFKNSRWKVDEPQLPTNTVPISRLEHQAAYEVDNLLSGCRRAYESNTSLDKLIQFPFDYVVEYMAKLYEAGDAQLSDLDMTMGNVAHLVVEQWVNDFKGGNAPFALPDNLDDRINAAINQKGAVLLLPENQMECTSFIAKLKESLRTLADIILSQHLRPVGSEEELLVDLPEIGPFKAFIDLLLKDTKGRYVIFDLKWTMSGRHKESLEKNVSLQLELYRQAAKVHYGLDYLPRVAYYLLPQCKLVAADTFAPHNAIEQVKVDAARAQCNLFEEIKAAVRYRRGELDTGHIEQSELMPLDGIPYAKQAGLVPLKEHDYLQGCKRGPYASQPQKDKKSWDKPTDPKKIATTHPILKDRLQ